MSLKIQYLSGLILFIASAVFCLNLSAEMYKWVDEQGNTHYTQSLPPENINAETIKPPAKVDSKAAQKLIEQQQEKVDSYEQKRKKLAEKQATQLENELQKKQNCEISRSNAAKLERPRIRLNDEQGNTHRISEQERQNKLKVARKEVKKYCG